MPRIDAETALYGRWAGLLDFVYQRPTVLGMTAPATNRPIAPTGTTELYNDPLGYALSIVGSPSPTPGAVTDSDVDGSPTKWFTMLDLAEYRMLQSLIGSFTDVTESDNGRSASYNQLADRAISRADALAKKYESLLKPYRGGASSGAVRFVPPTAFPPRYRPGYGGPSRGYGGYNGGGGYGGWGW